LEIIQKLGYVLNDYFGNNRVASNIPWDLGAMIHKFSQENYVNPSLGVLLTIVLD
jgi:hypothetical protein